MRVSVFGLGYVGCVTAACLARNGIEVVGVDLNELKVGQIENGSSPVLEPGLDELIAEGVASGRLTATTDGAAAVASSDLSLVCVGTPSAPNGGLELRHVESVCREIAAALREKDGGHVVVIRSTVLPGTTEGRLLPILESESGRRVGSGLGVCVNPEFLREGTAIDDYFAPSFVVIGETDPASGDVLEQLYAPVEAPRYRASIATAEMVKYTCNAFHAVKVAFANEIGSIARAHGVDGREVMEIFVTDSVLNISPTYLRPGYAFGGSCLPKDLRALLHRARERDVAVPLLDGTLESNESHLRRGIRLVEASGCKRPGILGLSFKNGTDDVRESPAVALIETLVGRGYDVSVFDDDVDPDRLVGANRQALERELPHIAALMRPSVDEVLAESDVVVVTKRNSEFASAAARLRDDQKLIDLAGVVERRPSGGAYDGIAW